MPSHPRSAWERLGELLVRRRIELDPRYRNRRTFEAERAPDLYRIINSIELGRRDNYEPGTIAALEAAYDIAPGAIGRALDGGELEVQAVAADTAGAADEIGVARRVPPHLAAVPPSLDRGEDDIFPDMDAETRARVEAHVPAVEALVRSAAIDGPLTSGNLIFRDPHEAEMWDRLVEVGQDMRPGQGYTLWQLIRLMAVGRVRADERHAGNPPARVREVLTFPSNNYASAGLTGAPAAR